jgi:hypothetical protein
VHVGAFFFPSRPCLKGCTWCATVVTILIHPLCLYVRCSGCMACGGIPTGAAAFILLSFQTCQISRAMIQMKGWEKCHLWLVPLSFHPLSFPCVLISVFPLSIRYKDSRRLSFSSMALFRFYHTPSTSNPECSANVALCPPSPRPTSKCRHR